MAEGILGLIVATFLAFAVIVLGIVGILQLVIYGRNPPPPYMGVGLVTAWVLASVFQWRSVALYARGMDFANHPLPVHIAMSQRTRALPLRPVVALWWLANAAALVIIAHGLASSYVFINPGAFERALRVALPAFVVFSSAVAANTYLLLAVSAVSRNRSIVEAVWRIRVLLDLAIVFAAPRIGL